MHVDLITTRNYAKISMTLATVYLAIPVFTSMIERVISQDGNFKSNGKQNVKKY